jgi:preprotein translocase subunit SecE
LAVLFYRRRGCWKIGRVTPHFAERKGIACFCRHQAVGKTDACGPISDFRGDAIPKKGPAGWLDLMDRALSGPVRIHEMAKVSPFKFLQEVRQETAKVTWPTRRETFITTIMVFVMATLAGIFFLLADQMIRFLVTLVLGIGS